MYDPNNTDSCTNCRKVCEADGVCIKWPTDQDEADARNDSCPWY